MIALLAKQRARARRQRPARHHDVRDPVQRDPGRAVSRALRRLLDRLQRHDAADARRRPRCRRRDRRDVRRARRRGQGDAGDGDRGLPQGRQVRAASAGRGRPTIPTSRSGWWSRGSRACRSIRIRSSRPGWRWRAARRRWRRIGVVQRSLRRPRPSADVDDAGAAACNRAACACRPPSTSCSRRRASPARHWLARGATRCADRAMLPLAAGCRPALIAARRRVGRCGVSQSRRVRRGAHAVDRRCGVAPDLMLVARDGDGRWSPATSSRDLRRALAHDASSGVRTARAGRARILVLPDMLPAEDFRRAARDAALRPRSGRGTQRGCRCAARPERRSACRCPPSVWPASRCR